MAPRSKKQKEIVLTRDNLLKQPMVLSLLPYRASINQIKVMLAVVRRLQVIFKAGFDTKCKQPGQQLDFLSMLDDSEVRGDYVDEDDLMFNIHLKDLGLDAKHYSQAFNTLWNLAGIVCAIPVQNASGGKGVMFDTIFKPIVWEDNVYWEDTADGKRFYHYRKPHITIVIKKRLANYLFDMNGWMDSMLDFTIDNAKSSYEARLYIFLSSERGRHPKQNVLLYDYEEVRKICGFIGEYADTYKYFSDFEKRVLKPAKLALDKKAEENISDISFDYRPIYKYKKSSGSPEKIEFTIHLSSLGQKFALEKKQDKTEIDLRKFMKEKFMLTVGQINGLISKVDPRDLHKFSDKAHSLWQYISKKAEIKKEIRSYAYKSLNSYIEEELSNEAEYEEVEPMVEPKKEEKKVETPQHEKSVIKAMELTEEQKTHFKNCIDEIEKLVAPEIFRTCYPFVEPILITPSEDKRSKSLDLTIKVPTDFIRKMIEDSLSDEVVGVFKKYYGKLFKLHYVLEEPQK